MNDMIIGPDSGAPFLIVMVAVAVLIIITCVVMHYINNKRAAYTKKATVYTYVPRVRVYPAPYDWASPLEQMDYDTLMVDCPADPYHNKENN